MSNLKSKIIVSIFIIVVLLAIPSIVISLVDNGVENQLFTPLIGNVAAQDSSVADILRDEAGITAYFQWSSSIDLEKAKSVFRTIEKETDEYVIGSVPVDGYSDEFEDAHVLVSKDGWLIAYYLSSDPASKLIDSESIQYSGNFEIGTKLEKVLKTVAAAAEIGYGEPKFYDFRNPDATHMMMIVGDNFEIELPSSFEYYERSFSSMGCTVYRLDGEDLGGGMYGVIVASQMLPDSTHNISGCYKTAIMLIYREQ